MLGTVLNMYYKVYLTKRSDTHSLSSRGKEGASCKGLQPEINLISGSQSVPQGHLQCFFRPSSSASSTDSSSERLSCLQ